MVFTETSAERTGIRLQKLSFVLYILAIIQMFAVILIVHKKNFYQQTDYNGMLFVGTALVKAVFGYFASVQQRISLALIALLLNIGGSVFYTGYLLGTDVQPYGIVYAIFIFISMVVFAVYLLKYSYLLWKFGPHQSHHERLED